MNLVAAVAMTWWLNIPGYCDPQMKECYPDLSIPTTTRDVCMDAIVEYAKEDYVFYIGCDIKPLPNAVNLKKKVFK